MNKIILIFCLLLIPSLGLCNQSVINGEFLLHTCIQTEKQMNQIRISFEEKEDSRFCIGYVSGVSESLSREGVICTHEASMGQIIEVVTNYLKQNPKLLPLHRNLLTFTALQEAFPCK